MYHIESKLDYYICWQQISLACRRKGIDEFGKIIAKDEKIHIDMIVLGSVAVSKEGSA